jgi:hypothetical protein
MNGRVVLLFLQNVRDIELQGIEREMILSSLIRKMTCKVMECVSLGV